MLIWIWKNKKKWTGRRSIGKYIAGKREWQHSNPPKKKIIAGLKKKDDAFLKEIVDYRKYNFRFLINGMIEHNIYHLGQIAYLNKILK